MSRPKVTSAGEKELEQVQSQFDTFDKQIKDLTLDRMNETPKKEVEPIAKLSSQDIDKSQDIYLKPARSISSREKFNESFREQYNFQKEYVKFIPENREIIGEVIEIWTKPFAGMPAEFWKVPVGKPVWGPRYLAEQIKKCHYHRLTMENKVVGSDHAASYYGNMVVDTTIQRLDALPVSTRKSIFMGAS